MLLPLDFSQHKIKQFETRIVNVGKQVGVCFEAMAVAYQHFPISFFTDVDKFYMVCIFNIYFISPCRLVPKLSC